jgi:hypothetical protein
MDDESRSRDVLALTSTADRLDALAETAELMGDEAGACRFRERASACRMRAMQLLDDC